MRRPGHGEATSSASVLAEAMAAPQLQQHERHEEQQQLHSTDQPGVCSCMV